MCAMKISFAFCFAVSAIAVTQLCASNFISEGGNEEITTENGTDIRVTQPELMEVNLTNHELTFEICTMNCFTSFLVCYEPNSSNERTKEWFTLCDPTCGFYVTGDVKFNEDNNTVRYTFPDDPQVDKIEECDVATMKFNNFTIRSVTIYPSCKPKIENGLINLNVSMASSTCPVIIKNAQFKRDPSAPTVLPSNNDPSKLNSTSPNSPSGQPLLNVYGIAGWIFVLIILCFLHQ